MFGSNFRGFVSQEQSQSNKILKKSGSRDSGAEEEFEVLEQGEIKERRHSGDSGNCSEAEETNRAIELEFQLTQSLLSQVKANENNGKANSGKQAKLDLKRMNFVINGEIIDKECVLRLYGKDNHLIHSGREDYHLFAKQVFIGMFEYAKAEVPSDDILEELITHCNQSGYQAFFIMQAHNILEKYGLLLRNSDKKIIDINCSDRSCVRVSYKSSIPICNSDNIEKEVCKLGNSLEFALKSQNGEVEYENGKVTLTIPEELKAGREGLLDDINKHFEDADNAIVEILEKNMKEGPKLLIVNIPSNDSLADSSKVVDDPGILGNIANVLVGAAEIGAGIATELLWHQEQICVESKRNEEEFTIITEGLIFDELVDIINKAKNDDYKDLDEVVNNIEESDRFITDLNPDNFRKFCSHQLNLVTQMYNVLLENKCDGVNGNYNYSVKELVLLAIAADDKLVERYAETHNSMLFTQDEELDRLLIGFGGQCYVKFLLEYLEKKTDSVLPWHSICEKLKRASSIGNQECVKAILDRFKNTEAKSRAFEVPSKWLHYTIQQDFKDVAKIIIDHKVVDINSIDNLLDAPLHYAVARKNLSLITLLIENSAEVDIKDKRCDRTALHWAAYYGKFEIVKLLVKEGADWSVKDKDGKIALDLVEAGKSSSKSEITKFLEDLDSTTPLHYAVENNNFCTSERLLKKGVDVNAKDQNSWISLGLAIRDSKLKFVKLLLNHEADVNIKTRNNWTHLSLAIQKNEAKKSGQTWEIVNLLVEKGARISKEEFKEAVSRGNSKVVELLVNKGAVITQEVVQHANKLYQGRSCIISYPGGSEGGKQARAEILGFLKGKFSNMQSNSNLVNKTAALSQTVYGENKSQKSQSTYGEQNQKNVYEQENIMNNKNASIEEAIGNNCKEGKMHSSDQNIKAIEKMLSDAISGCDYEEVRSLVEKAKREGNNVEPIINEAFRKANEMKVKQQSVTSKNKLKKIKGFLKKELSNVAALSGGDVEATAGSKEVPVVEPKGSSSSLNSEEDDYSRLKSDKSSGSSPLFEVIDNEMVPEVVESETMPSIITERVEAELGSTYASEAQLTSSDKDNLNDHREEQAPDQSAKCVEEISNENTQPKPTLPTINKQSNKSNQKTASQNTSRYIVATSALAITGIAAGIAIAVYLEMLAMGVTVAACCLVAATVIYYCAPKSQVENSEVEKPVDTRETSAGVPA